MSPNTIYKSYQRALTEDEQFMEAKMGRKLLKDEFVIRLGTGVYDVFITDRSGKGKFNRNAESGNRYIFTPASDNIHVNITVNNHFYKTCEYCGKIFLAESQYYYNKQRFCSHQCAMNAQVKNGVTNRYKHSTVKVVDPVTGVGTIQAFKLHRQVAEQMLGRPLKPGEIVHHINFDRRDNRPENLIVFDSNKSHIIFHRAPIGTYIMRSLGDGTFTCDYNCIPVVEVANEFRDGMRKRLNPNNIL